MACIEHYIKDAENIFNEIVLRHGNAQNNVYIEYLAARTIQRWFRGYVTRKHLAFLNSCATTIQKHWRGYVDRKYYNELLKDAVHKMFLEYYNQMATKIQKVWRGHHVRTHIFSYYKLKAYINEILNKNREFLEEAKDYEAHTKHLLQKMKQEECQEWLSYLSFRVHHLIRTHQIEGVYSNHGTCEYSNLEQHLKNAKFKDFMDLKRAKEKQKQLEEPQHNYIFEGRLRECEEVWLHRNDPGKYSLATGEYGRDKQEYQKRRKISQILHQHQDIPMKFLPVRYQDGDYHLNAKTYRCPPLHSSVNKRNS
ncbi:spermatogenesis-associated protein 17-like [Homalodisca vitripennis]|uniref:spermatogenesis-associated protein 17-like n=1 Tax=Homalodisca vitripennis TaxID=197043 RepID=UPI001EEB0BC1|nr:spermatogenesis-associated protein 17-like [Homalodisca vitripennis]